MNNLPAPFGRYGLCFMRLLLKQFLAALCLLALVSGSTLSFAAMSASADEPCAHAHSQHGGAEPHKHHHQHGAGCLACCLGACAAIAALPAPSSVSSIIFTETAAAYWEATAMLNSRSIAPDPDPPRSPI
jgi:hypothetical protein